MQKILSLLLFLFATLCCPAQSLTGDWGGSLKIGPQSLRIVLHIAAADSGYTATMDSPDQGSFGLVADSVFYHSPQLKIKLLRPGITLSGTVAGDTLRCALVQGLSVLPLTLTRGDFALRRPQEPKLPFPYRSEEVFVQNLKDSVTLAGTLTLPEGKGPFPGVVLVTGSGAQNRNEELMGHKPFAVIADYLTRRGIAVLRCDDRGVGGSTGDFETATTEDFTRDALAGFDYLRTRPEFARKKVGILGHSEGGTAVFMAAAQNRKVTFVVSLAGVAARGDSMLLVQNRKALLTAGIPDSVAGAYVNVLRDVYRLQENFPVEYLRTHRDSLAQVLFPAGPRGSLPIAWQQNAVNMLTTPEPVGLRFLKRNDAKPYVLATRCPVLAVNGTKDVQVDAAINLGLIKRYAAESENKRITTKAYEGLNHLFQHAITGSPNEYVQIEETISPEVLADIAAWILITTVTAPDKP